MTVYIVAVLNKYDPETYSKYSEIAGVSLEPYPGSRVAADDSPVTLEGDLTGNRVVLLKFRNEAECDTWWNSEQYRKAVPFRFKSADTRFIAKIKARDESVPAAP